MAATHPDKKGGAAVISAFIADVAYYLPSGSVTNDDLSRAFPEWSVDKISAKTGIEVRHIAGPDEFTSDLATGAARALASAGRVDLNEVDYLIVCTQSPDYFLPTTACMVHENLGLRSDAGAIDINLGCSGYVYGMGLAKGLIESGQVRNVLLITADTYSKFLNPEDKSVRTIFGDAASATFVSSRESSGADISALVYGSDGSGAKHLMVPRGGLRPGADLTHDAEPEARGLQPSSYDLYMNGPEIFNFTLRVVPETFAAVLAKAEISEDEVDLVVVHQANAFMLEHLRKKLAVPTEKFFVHIANCGNTVSSTIPIALAEAAESGVLRRGMNVLVMGFGVGLSWGGFMLRW
ncbi:MAG: ketoacyl-ACP synthase III [Cryobacterium sp.]|nr:ketoacyl-ACP synthase III [Cryobacterium sp.]